jgi:hypothetical protein
MPEAVNSDNISRILEWEKQQATKARGQVIEAEARPTDSRRPPDRTELFVTWFFLCGLAAIVLGIIMAIFRLAGK